MMAATGSNGSRRPGRLLTGLLLVALVLAVLLAIADRIAVKIVERRLADNVQTSQQLSRRPTVTIHRFPFLTQVLRGKYADVSIAANGPVSRNGVQVEDASVDLRGVRVNLRDALKGTVRKVPVRTGSGSAFLPYSQLTALVSRYAGSALGSSLTVTGTTPGHARISGPFGISVNVGFKVTDGKLTVVPDAGALAQLPALARPIVTSALARPIPLPTLPFGVTLTSAKLESGGVQLHATASDVIFPV